MNKKTILVLASTFPRWKNDNEPRFVYDLSRRLAKQFNIVVLTSHYSGSKSFEKLDKLTVYRYHYAPAFLEKLVYNGGITSNLKHNKLKWLLVPFFFLGQLVAILKILKKYHISIIHAHWLIPQGFLAHIAVKLSRYNAAIICTSHGGDLFGLNDPISIKIKQWVLNGSNAITVVSSTMKNKVLELAPKSDLKLSIIPMGTDLENTFIPSYEVIRKENMLLFVGRLVEKKGVDLLIQAFANIHTQYSKLELFIIGDGPEKNTLEKLVFDLNIHTAVHFTGKVSHNNLPQWYNRATIAIFPFKEARNKDIEGLGLVLVEAMGCKCPVIVGDVPAIHDVIKHQETGLIFAQNDIDALEKNILELLKSPQKRKQLTSKAYQYVRKHFSWDSSYREFLRLMNNTLTEND